ncbi:hypothetical protein K504DRAFT_206324 [Pleomassaria siparia CBS 279.74]|uniref:Uncharacterized protein n=1 Tax=Pleomassaria siparia CBS 279.74 TaxID=1314801 RepID=A0A6G1KIT2_9PLEO|nr:hypothetical protein K504DRAFT_206324 [Pleomassaria siparia CBS 279.74]
MDEYLSGSKAGELAAMDMSSSDSYLLLTAVYSISTLGSPTHLLFWNTNTQPDFVTA